MRNKKTYILFFLLVYNVALFSQVKDTLTLEFCRQKALENYPLIKQKDLLNKSSEIKLNNIGKTYLPQLSLNGQATYQSDVIELPVNIPGMDIPSLYKDAYKATFDITQVIYNGGLTAKQKELESASLASELQNLESELYKIKDRVNTIYFSIIAVQESRKLLLVLKEDIKNKLAKVESGVKNGILLESNSDILKAEIIKTDEQIIELESSIDAGFKMLADYTNTEITERTRLKLPDVAAASTDYLNTRPEIKAFELQQKKLEVSKSLLGCKLMPAVSCFGQLGYGRPGQNMLSNSFDSFFMLGAKISWTIYDWNQTKNEKQLLELQSQVIETQLETFNQTIKILLEKNIADIQKYKDLLVKDNEIITLREKIVKAAASQLENGIITSTEYLTELNAAAQAKINMEAHRILLAKAQVDYMNVKGSEK